MEKAICADRELRALDEAVARDFDAATKQLSPAGRRSLRDGQTRWLRHVGDVCFRLKNRRGGAGCVENAYRARLEDLRTAAVRVGPFLFTRIDYFYAFDDPASDGPFHGQTSYPQIDRPASEAIEAWNAVAAPTSGAVSEGYCDGRGDVRIGFQVVSASAAAISVAWSESAYCHGAPHPLGGTMGRTHLLGPPVRLLGAEDLFDAGSSWKATLTDRCWKALAEKAPGALTEADRSRIERVVTQPRAWVLGEQGLTVSMGAGSVLAYAQGATVVIIPWKELRPFLAPAAPVPG